MTEVADLLAQALQDLLQRVKLNGGLGEYKGGQPFAIQRAKDALDTYRRFNRPQKPEPKALKHVKGADISTKPVKLPPTNTPPEAPLAQLSGRAG